jgi:hypothetical protein
MAPSMKKKLYQLYSKTDEIFKDLDSHAKWMRKFKERATDRKEGPMMKELRERLKETEKYTSDVRPNFGKDMASKMHGIM